MARLSLEDWEPIDAELRNVRGFNYVAAYPSLEKNPPADFDDYNGVGSSTTMWALYDPLGDTSKDVDEQLRQMRRAGVNALRVFLSFPAWEHFHLDEVAGNRFIDRFQHLLGLCEQHRIRCIPVLWDSTFALASQDPIDASLNQNIRWHRNPGTRRIHEMLDSAIVDPGKSLRGTPAEFYLRELILVAHESEAFLAWNLMNEPAISPDLYTRFLRATLDILDEFAPEQPTMLGLLFSDPPSHDLARDPRVDILDIHPYGSTRAAIEAMAWDASHIEDPASPTGFVRKPILATEIGTPGEAQAYQNAINFARNVPRPDLGPDERGVGFTPFGSHLTGPDSDYPLQQVNGVFYTDGTVREADIVIAWIDAAREDGIDEREMYAREDLVEKEPGDELHVAQSPIPRELDAYDDFLTILWMPVAGFARLNWVQYLQIVSAFRIHARLVRVADFASKTNGNPWGPASDRPGAVVSDSDRELFDVFARTFIPEPDADGWPRFAEMLTRALGEPFDPNARGHAGLAATLAFTTWREVLRPYFVGQGGPY